MTENERIEHLEIIASMRRDQIEELENHRYKARRRAGEAMAFLEQAAVLLVEDLDKDAVLERIRAAKEKMVEVRRHLEKT